MAEWLSLWIEKLPRASISVRAVCCCCCRCCCCCWCRCCWCCCCWCCCRCLWWWCFCCCCRRRCCCCCCRRCCCWWCCCCCCCCCRRRRCRCCCSSPQLNTLRVTQYNVMPQRSCTSTGTVHSARGLRVSTVFNYTRHVGSRIPSSGDGSGSSHFSASSRSLGVPGSVTLQAEWLHILL